MTLKVLLDPVLTASPSRCSTTVQFHEFVTRALKTKPGVFFYWVVPEYVTEEEFKFYPQDPRVQYLRAKMTKDRVREYLTFTPELEEWIAFNGSHWDIDVVLTVRTGLVPLMKLIMSSPRDHRWSWTKQVWVIEEMPMVSFKETVPQMVPGVHDRFTIEGYLAAERVWVCSYHEGPGIVREARNHFAPSLVAKLSQKITPIVTAQREDFGLKITQNMFVNDGEQAFGLAYIGRMEKANNIVDIHKIMGDAWILRGEKVKPIVCTVSRVVKEFDEEVIDVRFPPREEFWKICQEEMHAFIYMPKGGGFSLSLIEPLMLGVPVIALRDESNLSMLGPDYPFYAPGPASVYGVFKLLYDDYENQYKKFAEWQMNWMRPTYQKRFKEDLLYPKLLDALDQTEQYLMDRRQDVKALGQNEIVNLLAEDPLFQHGKETMFETLDRLHKEKKVGELARKLDENDRFYRSITFSTPWNMFRLGLKLFHGFEDASTRTGHMIRISPAL